MSTPAFVEQLYLTFLGRPADDAGRAFWSQAIEAGALSAAEVTRQFLESAEFSDAVAPVARLYYSAFARIPDGGGLAFWLTSAQAGASLDSIANAFVLSPEFAEVYGAARHPEFIDLIYQNALGHAPEASAKAYWLDQLAQGQASRADVLAAIASSAEMAAASSAAIKVIAQYHGITGSSPTRQQIDSALLLEEPLTLINQLYASSSYTGAPVPHPFVTDNVATGHGGGATIIDTSNKAPVIDASATGPSGGVTPTIVLAFSQDVHAAGGMIYITDGAAQTVIDRATGLPKVRIVGATDTRAIDVNDAAHVSFDGERVTITVSSALKSGVSYSVLIGKGVLEGANGMAFGGISDPGTLNFTPSGDSTPPDVVSFALDRATFNAGDRATMTIEFSEIVERPDAADFNAPNGTLSGFDSANGGRTWTALFTPTAMPVDAASNMITLRAGSVRDMAGNLNAQDRFSGAYAVDTIVTAVVDSKLEFNDTGISASDRLTNDATQTMTGKFVGAPSGMTLQVVINGMAHAVPPSGDNTWSFSGGVFTEGHNDVVAYFTNVNGKKSAERTLSFTLDTTAPAVTNGLPATVDPATPLSLTFSEAVYWRDDNATIAFTTPGGATVSVGIADVGFSEDLRTMTIDGSDVLSAGTSYTLTLPASLTDAAGNSVAAPLQFGTPAGPDVTPPQKLSVVDLVAASDSGRSASDDITRDTRPAFAGTLGAEGDIVKLFADGLEVGSATVGAGGAWTVAPTSALAEGSRSITARFVDAAGNVGEASAALGIVIDTTAPTLLRTNPANLGTTDRYVNLEFSEEIVLANDTLQLDREDGLFALLLELFNGARPSVGSPQASNDPTILSVDADVGPGTYSLYIGADSIHDIAGNSYAAIVGTRVVTFTVD